MTTSTAISSIVTTSFAAFPKKFPSNYILKLITFPPPKSDFQFSKTLDGRVIKPKISFRIQDEIRTTCQLAGLDAEKLVGLPPLKEREITDKSLMALGSDKLKVKQKRQTKIADNLGQMEKRVATYREERRSKKLSQKSDLPF